MNPNATIKRIQQYFFKEGAITLGNDTFQVSENHILGYGSFGVVYEVVDQEGCVWALKVISTENCIPLVKETIRCEIMVINTLMYTQQSGIIGFKYAKFDEKPGFAVVVMEKFGQGTLSECGEKFHQLNGTQLLSILIELLYSAEQMQSIGICHRYEISSSSKMTI